MRTFFYCGFISAFLLIGCGASFAKERTDSLRNEMAAISATLQEVLNRIDLSARHSEEVSNEVKALKSKGRAGIIDQVRMEALLSRLREILLERRELKKIELNLTAEKRRAAAALHGRLGEEIRLLLREGEARAQQKEIQRADQIHKEVLTLMRERQTLLDPAVSHIPALPQIEIPDTTGASSAALREMAVLLKNDAEGLDKKKSELIEEKRLLQEDLQIKQTLARLQGFPRGMQKGPMDLQVRALEEKRADLDRAIRDHADAVQALSGKSDEILTDAKKKEEDLLK